MFRRSLIVSFILGALPVAAAAWVFSPALMKLGSEPQPVEKAAITQNEAPQAPKQEASPPGQSAPQESAHQLHDLDALKPRDGTAEIAAFDVARIDPEGISVFAGTAPAHSTVTVTANGETVGTAEADERGEWTLVSDRKIPGDNPVLGLSARIDDTPKTPAMPEPAPAQPPAPVEVAAAPVDHTKQMMRDFEDLVAAAREPAPSPAPQPAAVQAPVPIPIQFVYREAAFTPEGRKAAELLSDYVKLKKPQSMVMTGHADERGSDAFNLELSRQRLETVANFLKENGFQGDLVLIPKGRSEPYQGVDRSRIDREALWQLDRRVEIDLRGEITSQRSALDAMPAPAKE